MRTLKLLFLSSLLVGLGIWMASYEVAGRTPLQHLQRAWRQNASPAKIEGLKRNVSDAIESAKTTVVSTRDPSPREHHSVEDRQAVNDLIAKHQGSK